jgi:hypothetical protein
VECWGSNNTGQSAVPAGLVAFDLVAGPWYTCALPTSGGVKCWGDAVGIGSPMDSQPGKPTTGTFAALFGGETWACAQDSLGGLQCFGPNRAFSTATDVLSLGIADNWSYAQVSLLTGAISAAGFFGTPPAYAGGYAMVDCGEEYCCAIRETRLTTADRLQGAVECWGNNTPTAFGQTAGRVSGAPSLTTPTALVSAGDYAACAIDSRPGQAGDLALRCWGSNHDNIVSDRPAGAFSDVSVGTYHACAVDASSASEGDIRCWGSNVSGAAPSFRE